MIRKHPTLLPFLCLVLLLGLSSCDSNAQVRQKKCGDGSILFQISHDSLPEVSYLYGTIHMTPQEKYRFTDTMKALVKRCDLLVLEIGEFPNHAEQLAMLRLPEGQKIQDLIPKAKYDSLVDLADRNLGLSPLKFDQTFGNKKPFALLEYLSVQPMMGEPMAFYEIDFITQATLEGTRVKGLETVQQQLSFFDSIPSTDVVDMCIEMMSDLEGMKQQTSQLQQAHYCQDIDRIEQLVAEEYSGDAWMKYADLLLYDRNQRWIPLMEDYMKDGSCFFAVGAGHLIGERGVIQKLKDAGFSVNPIPNE